MGLNVAKVLTYDTDKFLYYEVLANFKKGAEGTLGFFDNVVARKIAIKTERPVSNSEGNSISVNANLLIEEGVALFKFSETSINQVRIGNVRKPNHSVEIALVIPDMGEDSDDYANALISNELYQRAEKLTIEARKFEILDNEVDLAFESLKDGGVQK